MKILFVNLSPLAIDVSTPDREPLGGTESCACYLARQMAANGHDVTLVANLPPGTPAKVMNVPHFPPERMDEKSFWDENDFEAAVCVANPLIGPFLRGKTPRTFVTAWQHMHPDQEAATTLMRNQHGIDCAMFVSNNQRDNYRYRGVSHVIGNGFAPWFENMFPSAAALLAAKRNLAVYTSMPFRGLAVLVGAMELTRAATELEIYSAMRTYRLQEGPFQTIYDEAKRNPKVRYQGAVGQRELAERLKQAAFFTYPCTFIETYCIAAVEAMAAGLKVITTDLGPLKDTTMGFADLLRPEPGMKLLEVAAAFAPLIEKNEAEFLSAPQAWAEQRFDQMRIINRDCSWKARAAEWEAFLGPAVAAKRA